MPRLAILLYVYHLDLWSEIKLLLNHCENFAVFLAVSKSQNNNELIQECTDLYNVEQVLELDNKGLDIYPFLQQLNKIDAKKYPYFLKIHTKKSKLYLQTLSNEWFYTLINSCIGSKKQYFENIQSLEHDKNIGSLCDEHFIVDGNERIHHLKVIELCKYLKIDYTKVQQSSYMLGSIFFGKTILFKKVLTPKAIKQLSLLLESDNTYSLTTPNYAHALECVMGYLVHAQKHKIQNIKNSYIHIYNTELDTTFCVVKMYNNKCYIKGNIFITGDILKETYEELIISWSNRGDVNVLYYIRLDDEKYTRSNDTVNTKSFNVHEYKLLNNDLHHLTDDEAFDHYCDTCTSEHRVYKKQHILDVFDKSFYSKKYTVPIEQAEIDYIYKGKYEGRVINNAILNNSFDYGYYITHYDFVYKNKYTALKHYTENPGNKCNSIVAYNNDQACISSTCFYVCNIKNNKDAYNASNDINIISQACKCIVVTNNNTFIKNNKNITVLTYNKQINEYAWYRDFLLHGIEYYTKKRIKTEYIWYATNQSIILNNICDFLYKAQCADVDFLSLTDSYTKDVHTNKHVYQLNTSCLFFRKKHLKMLRTCLQSSINDIQSTYTFERHLNCYITRFLQDCKKRIGPVLSVAHETELLWGDMISVDMSRMSGILYKHKIPIVNKSCLNYFRSLIPRSFKKQKHVPILQSWLEQDCIKPIKNKTVCCILHIHTMEHLTEIREYIIKLNSQYPIDFYITGNYVMYKNVKKGLKVNMQYITTPNKGMDIGPFVFALKYFYKSGIKYDYIIKLQDKKTDSWRKLFFTNICDNLIHYLNLLCDNNVSVAAPYMQLIPLDDINSAYIQDVIIRNNIDFNLQNEVGYNGFIAGTMFILKHSVFNNFIERYNIDLDFEYSCFEDGAVTNNIPTYTHAWERILTCLIPTVMQTQVKCI